MRSSNIFLLGILLLMCLSMNSCFPLKQLSPFERKWLDAWNVSDTLFFHNTVGNDTDTLIFTHKNRAPERFKILGKPFTLSEISTEVADSEFDIKHKNASYLCIIYFNDVFENFLIYDNKKPIFRSKIDIEKNYKGEEVKYDNQLEDNTAQFKFNYIIISSDSIIKEYSIDNEVYRRVF